MGILIYLKDPMHCAYSDILGKRLYGSLTGFPPTEVPFSYYKKFRYNLQLAPYTKYWLENKYKTGKPFPFMTFTYKEIRTMPYESLYQLAKALLIEFEGRKSHTWLAYQVKKILRN